MSLIKVKVLDTQLTPKNGVTSKGKAYSLNIQENVFLELNGEVRRVPLTLQVGVSAYAPGHYTLDLNDHAKVGAFNRLEIDQYKPVELKPVAAVAGIPKVATN